MGATLHLLLYEHLLCDEYLGQSNHYKHKLENLEITILVSSSFSISRSYALRKFLLFSSIGTGGLEFVKSGMLRTLPPFKT